MISVLCPTRNRIGLLRRSITSLLGLCADPSQVQVCYAVDEDDTPTVAAVSRMMRPHDKIFVSPVRHGYGGFHIYANELSRIARGDWLMLWNDDALMLTVHWDQVIEDYDLEYVLSPRSNHDEGIVAFPVIPRSWVVYLGHFSRNPHNDTWWQYIGQVMERVRWLDVDVLHDRFDVTGNNNDQTYRDTRQQSLEAQTVATFWNEAIPLMNEDMVLLRTFLGEDVNAGTDHGE